MKLEVERRWATLFLSWYFVPNRRLSACRPTEPNVTTISGRMRSSILFKKGEQFLTSLIFGRRLFPFASGLHNAALVINISDRVKPICFSRVSKLSPDLSP